MTERLQNGEGGKVRVLVMDDQDSVRAVVCRMLDRLGYEAVGASEGEEAIALVSRARRDERPFAVVVLDMNVPGGLGGAATLAALRALDPQVVAIASTGADVEARMVGSQQHGFSAVLVKPFNMAQLAAVVARAAAPEPI